MAETTQKPAGRDAARARAAKARRRLAINLVIVLVVAGGIAAYWLIRRPHSDLPAGLVTDKAQRMDMVETVSATGSVTAQTGAMVKIGSQITGRIKRLHADVGAQMKADEVIAELDVPDLEAQVRSAEATLALNQRRLSEQQAGVGLQDTQTATNIETTAAGLALAQANLKQVQESVNLQIATAEAGIRQAQANATNSAANLKRTQELFDKGYVAQADVDNAKAQDGVNSAQLASAQENLKQVEESRNLQLATAEAGIRQAQANATNSAANLKREQELFDKGYVAQADVDNAKAQDGVNSAQLASAQENLKLVRAKVDADLASARQQLKQAQAALTAAKAGPAQNAIKREQVREAQAAVRQSQAALALSRAQLDKGFIRTPISGTVIQLAQQQGETIAAGLSAPTLIIVADLDRLQVDAFVDETDIGHVRLGQRAAVTVDAYPDHPFKGRVEKIASGSTMQQNVVTYDVTISLENPGHLLKPDMTASVDITVSRRANALVVPVDAVKPTARGATVTVQRGTKDKPQFSTIPVQTGLSDGEHTEIVRGLKDGEVVVIAGQVPGMNSQQQTPRFRGPLGFGGGGGRQGGTTGARQASGGGARQGGGGGR